MKKDELTREQGRRGARSQGSREAGAQRSSARSDLFDLATRSAWRGGVVLVALLCCLILGGAVLAQGSPNYDLTWNVVAGGGGTSQSAGYVLSGTNGQGVAGVSASANYRLGGGFWYGFGMPAALEHRLYLPSILK